MNNSVKVCVIPAAGKGSRWAPFSNYIPKEMLPLGTTPVIGHVIKEAIDSGCNEIIIVLDKRKKFIEKYINSEFKSYKVDFRYVHLTDSPGAAYSILQTRRLVNNRPFGLIWSDMPAIYSKPHLREVMDVFEKNKGKYHVASVAPYPRNNMLFYGEVLLKKRNGVLNVIHVCPRAKKPGDEHHKGNKFRLSSRYVYSASIFDLVERETSDPQKIEFDPIIFATQNDQKFIVHVVKGFTLDTGTPNVYAKAAIEYLKRS